MQPPVKLWILCLLVFPILSSIEGKRNSKFLSMRNRMALRRTGRENLKPKVCFDLVGCFSDPPTRLPLKRPPEHPSVIQTRFLLYTRSDNELPESLEYGDAFRSILQSRFNVSKPLKVLIHGYKGSGNDAGAILLLQAFLKEEDANILILDWARGAATTYSTAVANTELVGRQLALVLLDSINLGADPKTIHVVGFSLGAHIAGCASEVLKKKNILLGRITGLDPASPFFRHHLFREKTRKLDATDAQLVDVIHTDGSQDFADGFGLLKPIGHVDFFPNGGREQPGCADVKNSVVVSHLKEELNRDIACSHLRAWHLFWESLEVQSEACKFSAWPCPQGRVSYSKGTCFPMESSEWGQEMGYAANRGPLGIYYLATRGERPFCGQPLRASVMTMEGAPKTSGILFFKILQKNSTTTFRIRCTLPKRRNEWMMFYNIAAAEFGSVPGDLRTIVGVVWYEPIADEPEEDTTKDPDTDALFLNKLAIEDRKGNKWEYCGSKTMVTSKERPVQLYKENCMFP